MYKSLSADESNRNENNVDYAFSNAKQGGKEKSDLLVAEQKIKQLEKRIEELENRLPKKYDEVRFLNYQNRKRILVSSEISESLHDC